MKKVNPAMLNSSDEKDDHFAGLRGTRDTVACKLCDDGIGASVKHAATISEDEEAKLRELWVCIPFKVSCSNLTIIFI